MAQRAGIPVPIYFKVRATSHPSGLYLAWGSTTPLSADNPIFEPSEHVWFTMGKTRDEAMAALAKELDLHLGPTKWFEQGFGKR